MALGIYIPRQGCTLDPHLMDFMQLFAHFASMFGRSSPSIAMSVLKTSVQSQLL